MQQITLILKGDPMPKQSARARIKRDRRGRIIWKNSTPLIEMYQPEKYAIRTTSYIWQIKSQLPRGFKMFKNRVHILKYEVMYKPLFKHKRSEKTMKFLNDGGTIEKNTSPDLQDNLKKLPFDAMSGLVYSDDGIVTREFETSKVWGTEGKITIILTGE